MDKDARIKEIEAELEKRRGEIEELQGQLRDALERIAELEARLAKHSGNSSKPPSSDITKPKRPKKRKPKKRGGQNNRRACTRTPFPDDQVDHVVEHAWAGLDTERYQLLVGRYTTRQQVELVDRPWVVTEHRFQQYLDRQTGKVITTPQPGDVRLGLFGPRLLALTTGLKAELHGSFASIQALYRDALGLDVSTGYLVKAINKVSAALARPYQQLMAALQHQPAVNIDETGHPEAGERWWTWVGTCPRFTVFKIAPGRGSKYLYDLLGKDFEGTLCSDSFSAYLKFFKDNPQLEPQYCWAHLIRDLRHVAQTGDRASRGWAPKVLDAVKRLFGAWHRGQYKACGRALDRVLSLCKRPGVGKQARTLGKRVYKQRRGYGRFLNDPKSGIEPTNNAAERELRKLVLHRAATQGTRGVSGRQWWERVFSVRASCRKQQRSTYRYLVETLNAYANGVSPPMLV